MSFIITIYNEQEITKNEIKLIIFTKYKNKKLFHKTEIFNFFCKLSSCNTDIFLETYKINGIDAFTVIFTK